MIINVYKATSKPDTYGFAPDAAALPRDFGPWKFWKSVRLGRGIIGVDPAMVEANILAEGYHIATPLRPRQSS